MSSQGTIVLAEDDAKLRKLYTATLKAAGYYVLSAPNGVEALKLLGTVTPRLILLDIMMPEMNGIEACKRARNVVGNDVPILFLSALDRLDILQDCLSAGGDDYVIKSDSLKTLLERVQHWSKRAAGRSQTMNDRRAKALNQVATVAKAPGTAKQGDLGTGHDGITAAVASFVGRARARARNGFGQTVEEKRYLLGYAVGAFEGWPTDAKTGDAQFFDQLAAVLQTTKLLTEEEIADMIRAFREMEEDPFFKTGRDEGRNDAAAASSDGQPEGLQNFDSHSVSTAKGGDSPRPAS
ncbi:MAG: response regulator transcription factor [Kiloniellales bacterium]